MTNDEVIYVDSPADEVPDDDPQQPCSSRDVDDTYTDTPEEPSREAPKKPLRDISSLSLLSAVTSQEFGDRKLAGLENPNFDEDDYFTDFDTVASDEDDYEEEDFIDDVIIVDARTPEEAEEALRRDSDNDNKWDVKLDGFEDKIDGFEDSESPLPPYCSDEGEPQFDEEASPLREDEQQALTSWDETINDGRPSSSFAHAAADHDDDDVTEGPDDREIRTTYEDGFLVTAM